MDCKHLRAINCISFVFHPKNTSLFTLVHTKSRLRILQENLYTGLIINEFLVPLKEGNLQVDNYSLAYNQSQDMIILAFYNFMMIFSVNKKKLLMVSETQGKNPYYIQKMVTRGDYVYFTASEQRNIYSVSIHESVKNGSITSYNKFKISAEAEAIDLVVSDRVLVGLCNDKVLRVWSLENGAQLKGAAIEGIGMPKCLQFSKNMQYLLIGTYDGYAQAWDGRSLGVHNTKILSQKITNIPIQSISWFHYCGQPHSSHFLSFTEDGHIKLYSFQFDKKQNSQVIMAEAREQGLLYSSKHKIQANFMIQAHSYSNFIFFNPGVLLFMVDSFPLIYYPTIVQNQSVGFEQFVPNKKKELYYPRDMIFMQNMQIKRVKDVIEERVFLKNDLGPYERKIIKFQMRPLMTYSAPENSKFMLLYYQAKNIRIMTISNVNLNEKYENLTTYKLYNGRWVMFVGPTQYYQPFVLIVQEDKQTVTVLLEGESDPRDIQKYTDEQRKYFQKGIGQISTTKTNIKIHKVYRTPFRDKYVVLYQSSNLLRFSNNIKYDTQLMNYDVYTTISLRIQSSDIILDVIWTCEGEMGAVLCIDKVIFVNSDLKVMRSVFIDGYLVQGQWIGYTLLLTTKKDVQYLDIVSKPQQAYCLENIEKKYLIMRVMADRIFGIQKEGGNVQIRARYFNIMQMLVSGYLNYSKVIESIVDQQIIKRIIQCYAPYFIVNEEFIELLNERNLTKISKYFIQGNQKMYSRPLRAKILNDSYKIERFVPQNLWSKNKRLVLDLFLSYEEAKDSLDPYEKQKGQKIGEQLKNLIGSISFDSIRNITGTEAKGITIENNFGQKSLIQIFCDYNKEGEKIRMEIEPFKAEDTGQWLGHFHNYIESHIYYAEDASEGEKQIVANMMDENSQEQSQNEEQYNDLVIYYRLDDGKGTVIDDLSNFGNEGSIEDDQTWEQLDGEPMDFEDKWGKKCPPQFSLHTQITNARKLKMKKLKGFSIQIWVRPMNDSFFLLNLDGLISISYSGFFPLLQMKTQVDLQIVQSENPIVPKIGNWIHICFMASNESHTLNVYYNAQLTYTGKLDLSKFPKPQNLMIGENSESLQFTQFRFWKKAIDVEDIKQNMRMPLEIVAQKRKAFKMKIKQKKKKIANEQEALNPFAFDL